MTLSLTKAIASTSSTFVFSDIHKIQVAAMIEAENTIIENNYDELDSLKSQFDAWSPNHPDYESFKDRIDEQEKTLNHLGNNIVINPFKVHNKIGFVNSSLVKTEFDKAYTAFAYNIAIALINNADLRLDGMKDYLDKILPSNNRPTIDSVNAGLIGLIDRLNEISLSGWPTATHYIHHLDFEDETDWSLIQELINCFDKQLGKTNILITGIPVNRELIGALHKTPINADILTLHSAPFLHFANSFNQ